MSDHPEGTANDVQPLGASKDISEPLTMEEGVGALEDLFGTLDEEPAAVEESEEPEAQSDEPEQSGEPDDDTGTPDDEPDDDQGSDDEEPEENDMDAETLDVSDDMLVDLGNGQTATLAELKDHHGKFQKRVAEFQRGWTQKTETLAQDRREIEEQGQRVIDWAEKVRQERDYVSAVIQQYLPTEPPADMLDSDPITYWKQKAVYDQSVKDMQDFQQQVAQEQQQLETDRLAQENQIAAQYREQVLEQFPDWKDPEVFKQVEADVDKYFTGSYGFTREELATVRDPRFMPVVMDAIKYQKLKAEKPREKVKGKPKVLRPGKSQSAKGRETQGKQQRRKKLRETGSMTAAIDALMDLDL